MTAGGTGGDDAARAQAVLAELAPLGSEESRAGMARYGIRTDEAFGVSVYELRRVAKRLGCDHDLALAFWETGNHEARLLASMVDDPALVTEAQMEAWAAEFDSWDVCDQVTSNLFDKTPFAYQKVREWSVASDEWVKRAAFATAAALAVQDKAATDEPLLEILELCRREAGDDRTYVKKAVNWALRNVGKRNVRLPPRRSPRQRPSWPRPRRGPRPTAGTQPPAPAAGSLATRCASCAARRRWSGCGAGAEPPFRRLPPGAASTAPVVRLSAA